MYIIRDFMPPGDGPGVGIVYFTGKFDTPDDFDAVPEFSFKVEEAKVFEDLEEAIYITDNYLWMEGDEIAIIV